ncbi:sigma factor G inhibitor Gin [Alkalicoccobacillus murimartini]|uniref:Sigma factor G inhibitor Gin n=1 Tax=Alkalicoccobacillus murimartini TaxID=171685 RepID=A0ABT9YMQ0_9BACI|nr:sigma factor G inhibitor Gin [Alkalicoccobacillus murimartini]MDQ0209149.1 hypothetical protein [Alkalicoccobacillus murimartini]
MKKTSVIHVQLGHTCLICETRKTEGYKLCHSFVCESCERKIVTTDVRADDYMIFVNKMRGILPGQY